MAEAAPQLSFAFVFGMASGHLNPSLPVARALVAMGHRVHYLCREQMRAAIEDTGAEFHLDTEVETELYDGREPDIFGAQGSLQREYGLEGDGVMQLRSKLRHVQVELQMPGLIRWLRRTGAAVVTYCPLMTPEAAYAGRAIGIPSIALMTLAGPGSIKNAIAEFLARCNITPEQLKEGALAFRPRSLAIARINATYGEGIVSESDYVGPLGKLDVLKHSLVTLVTTIEEMQDPVPESLAEAYRADGVRFDAVGPLIDGQGAKRAAGHKYDNDGADEGENGARSLEMVRRARAAGRRVVLASMGTVLTGDSRDFGWDARSHGPDGAIRGLTGCELCRAAWGGVFDAFGRGAAEEEPLLVISLGPQADPLGEVRAPANAVCAPSVPQVELLRAGVDVFLTHGGQNSFTEALVAGVPVVVCPGFADQPANAAKAVALGAGLQVPRPDPDRGAEAAAAAAYRTEVADALRRVAAEPAFAAAAARCAERLSAAGGVPRAVQWMLTAAGAGVEEPGSRSAEPVGCGKAAETVHAASRRQEALVGGA